MATDENLKHISLGPIATILLNCLHENINSERYNRQSNHTAHQTDNETLTADNPDILSLTQLRGFRHELMTYYNQPNQGARLLRVVRRLQAKDIPNRLLSTTAIMLAACLLLDNPRVDVKNAGIELVRKWGHQFSIGDPMLSKGGDPPSTAYKTMTAALSLWQARITHVIKYHVSQAKSGEDVLGPLEYLNQSSQKAYSADSTTQPGSIKQIISIDNDNFVSSLGTVVEVELTRLRGEETTRKATKRHISSEESDESDQNTFDKIALVLRNTQFDCVHSLVCPDHDEPRMTREFLEGAQLFLQLDDESLGLLSTELKAFQKSAIEVFYRVAMNHMVRILGESYLSVLQSRVSALEITLKKNDGAMTKVNPNYLEDLKVGKEFISGLGDQMRREVHLQRDDFVKSSVQLLQPVKMIFEMVDSSEKFPRNLPVLLNATKEFASLRLKINILSADLAASQLIAQKLTSELKSCWSENRKLQKVIEVERIAMHKKYFSDIEAQVEARLQSEKTKSAAHISDIEAKAKRADAAEEALAHVQEALKNVTRERDGLASHKTDLDKTCKQLRADKAATERGYEQMRQDKEDYEVNMITVEADLFHTQAQLQDLETQTLHAAKSEVNDKSQENAQTGISVLTHVDQLTASDRLDMIAQRWRNDLSSAEAEKQECSNALQVTEDQIAGALQQLSELVPSAHSRNPYGAYGAGQSHRGRSGRTPNPSAPRVQSRSLTPASDNSQSAVSHQASKRPEVAVAGSPTRRGVPAQNQDDDEAFPPLLKPLQPFRGSSRAKILRLL